MNYKLNNRGERKKRQSVAHKVGWGQKQKTGGSEKKNCNTSREHAKISRINKERKKNDITDLDRHLVQYQMISNLMEAIKVNFLTFFIYLSYWIWI